MARIKHIAIRTADIEKTATFYKEAFGLKQVGLGQNGIYLTDGHLNIAVLKFQPGKNGAPLRLGVDHVGFQVDDVEATVARINGLGGKPLTDRAEVQSHPSFSATILLRDQMPRPRRASDRRFQCGLGRNRLSPCRSEEELRKFRIPPSGLCVGVHIPAWYERLWNGGAIRRPRSSLSLMKEKALKFNRKVKAIAASV